MRESAILCMGNAVVDLIARPVEKLPEPGGLLMLDQLEMHAGGNGPNCALALARLGAAAAVAGRVGLDVAGRFLGDELSAAGVDVSRLRVDSERSTGMTLVAVNADGERGFLHASGANAAFCAEDVDLGSGRFAILHAGSHFILPSLDGPPLAGLLRSARAAGIATSLDVCWDASGRWLELLAPCLPEADYFLPNASEAAQITGASEPERMAERLRALGVGIAVIKCGPQGCFASGTGWSGWVPAPTVAAVDSTGAGDCFVAGFLDSVVRGAPLPATLEFANACGALSATRVGAVAALRPRAEVERWLRDRLADCAPAREEG